MMLAYPNLLTTTVTGPEPVPVSPIQPKAAPLYIQPVSVPLLPAPTPAPPPPDQFRGEGGTTFGVSSGADKPVIYIQPIVPEDRFHILDGGGIYAPPPNDSGYNVNQPTVLPPVTRERPGDSTIQPVPTGQQPTKPDVAPAVVPVTVPASAGPIKGQFLGFDLGIVPLWAWLVGAALIGARILR